MDIDEINADVQRRHEELLKELNLTRRLLTRRLGGMEASLDDLVRSIDALHPHNWMRPGGMDEEPWGRPDRTMEVIPFSGDE